MARAIDNLSQDVRDDLAELALKLSQNAETRKPFIAAVKKIDPNRRFPAHEVEELREELKAQREAEKAEREIEDQRRATEARLTSQRQALIGRGYTDDDLKEVEAVMTKYGIADYEAGADLYQARKPAQVPAEQTGTWDFPTLPGLVEDPVKAARNEAYKVIGEIRRGRAA